MEKKRIYSILIISPVYYPYHLGGAEISTQMLAEGLSETGQFTVDVLTHGDNTSVEDNVNGLRVMRHFFFPFSKQIYMKVHDKKISVGIKILGKIGDLFQFRGREKYYQSLFRSYDAVILSGNGVNLGRADMWRAAKKENVPFVQIIRDPLLVFPLSGKPSRFTLGEKLYRRFSTHGLRDVPYVVSVTNWMLKLHRLHGITFQSEKVIYNMVDDCLCGNMSYEGKEDVILYVGSISTEKGCHTLIKAFQSVSAQIPSYRLVLIGRVFDVVIPDSDKIIAAGHMELNDVFAQMQKAKLVVLPSEWDEAFGRTVVEAVFNGTVSIGSDRGGIPEVFQYDREFLFRAGDVRDLAEKLVKFTRLASTEYSEKLNKLRVMFEKYKKEKIVLAWLDYLMGCVLSKTGLIK